MRPLGDGADVHVPEVDEVIRQPYELERLLHVEPRREVDADPHGDGAVVSGRLPDRLQRLQPHPGPVLQRAAVGVGALVVERRQELCQQVAMAAVDVDDVEADGASLSRRARPVGLDSADVGELHRLRHDRRVVVARDLRRRDRGPARVGRLRVDAGVRELDAGERAVLVHRIGHEGEVLEVVVVPQLGRDVRRLVRVEAHRRVLGADGRPAAFCLHAPMCRLRSRLARAEPRAVGHLVEAVAHRLRPDPHGLEEDVVARVAGDRGSLRSQPPMPPTARLMLLCKT